MQNNEFEKKNDLENNEELQNRGMALDDEQRVKVLSPTALVMKRFFRNRLAITGLIFIIGMFIFSYVGGWLMPYGEDQVFKKYDAMYKVFAGITVNEELKYIIKDSEEFPLTDRSQFILAIGSQESYFEMGDNQYTQEQIDENYYKINKLSYVAKVNVLPMGLSFEYSDDILSATFENSVAEASDRNDDRFEFNGDDYAIVYSNRLLEVYKMNDIAIATRNIFAYSNQMTENNYEFCMAVEDALRSAETSILVDDVEYNVDATGDMPIISIDGVVYANVSRYLIEPLYEDVFIDLEFREFIKTAVELGTEEFTYNDVDGTEAFYRLYRQNLQWTMEREESTYLIDEYASPNKDHLLGTDGYGMDLLTRIMYGGRISLRIGFIVVIIETVIGIILGGIAGYFGKFWDNLIMRVVDIFNCIPSLPLLIILGSIMDFQRIEPETRLYVLMFVLAILGWPGIARMVRGQILSLREQEFMTATEATGLRVSKRIFKHLIPNVIPQLIVICTLALGGVILTESVLSFLGVGVKFPFASWGNIINAVSNVHVMTNYLFVWIPAGFCILITVLGFNFIGDGLRDAFDPKMRR